MKQRIKALLYIPKHTKPTDENILRMLMPSLLGILLCMVCLAGTTWAWFSASLQTGPQTLTAANFEVTAIVTEEGGGPVTELQDGYALQADTRYTVLLKAAGSADEFGGYCMVESGEKAPLYTSRMKPGDDLQFTLIPPETAVYSFTAVWGSYSDEPDISDGDEIGQTQPSNDGVLLSGQPNEGPALGTDAYVVQSGDSLWEIAKQYDTTVEALAAENEIIDPDSLQIGQEIRLPADEEEPEEPLAQETPVSSSADVTDTEPTTATQQEITATTQADENTR